MWKVLKSDDAWKSIPKILEMIKEFNALPGVYVIYGDNGTSIIYVGCTCNLRRRLNDQIRFYLPHHIKIKVTKNFKKLERDLIIKLKPIYNVVIPPKNYEEEKSASLTNDVIIKESQGMPVEKPTVPVHISVKKGIKIALEILAKKDRRSLNAYTRMVLEDHVASKTKITGEPTNEN